MSLPLFWNVIINPNALNCKKTNLWKDVRQKLLDNGFQFKEYLSPSQEKCENLISALSKERQTNFIIVGGDGTLNEVLNALLKNQSDINNFLFALIPSGNGNDWARTHNIKVNINNLTNMFLNGRVMSHDIGKVTVAKKGNLIERYFINVAGLAFDAEVILRVNKSFKLNFGNKFLYLKNLFICLLYNKPNNCRFLIDNEAFDRPVFSIAIGICKYNGGGMMPVPMADSQDGLLDMVIIEPLNLFEIMIQLPKLYKGKHIGYKKIHHFRTSQIRIIPEHIMFAEVEGEIVGDGTFEIIGIPQKINVLVP